jgi:hypothetical protein
MTYRTLRSVYPSPELLLKIAKVLEDAAFDWDRERGVWARAGSQDRMHRVPGLGRIL